MPDDAGFYLPMLEKSEAVDHATWQCYSQLCDKLGYFNGTVQVTVDGKKVPLNLDVMATTPDPQIGASGQDKFFIFKMNYLKVFDDGSLLLKLIKDIMVVMGETPEALDAKLKSFGAKSNANLRAVYWYIDSKFVVNLRSLQQVAFTVDCMMFGGWKCNGRNLIGMHLVLLAWMLDVKQFAAFLPAEVSKSATAPPLKGFLEKKAIVLAITIKDIKTGGAGAGVAKTVDKKVVKDAKKGAKDDKKGAKDDKKGAKDVKKGAKDDKKGAKGGKK